MDNFNVNRRKPGPVPYGQQGSGGSLTNNVAAVILAAVIVVLVIVLAFMLLKPTKSKSIKGEIDRAELLLPQQSIKSEIDNNVDFGIDDSYNEPEIESKPQPEKPSPKKSYVGAKRPLPAISKQLPTSVTTVKGDRLNLLALKYYGDKVYWVYIYAANHTKLQNPDILPLNITLTIPLAQEHGIDLSRLSLRKAYALQRDILNNKSSFGSSSHNVPAQRSYQYNESYDDPYNDGNNYSDDYYDNDEGSIGGDYSGDGSGSDETTDDFGTNGDDLGSDDDFFGAKATGKNSRSTVKRSSGKTNTTNQSKPVSNRRLDVL